MKTRIVLPVILAVAVAGCGGGGSNDKQSGSYSVPTPKAGTIGVGKAVAVGPGLVGTPDTGILKNLPQPAGVGTGNTVCASASAAPSAANLRLISNAVLCLLNSQRTARGLKRLRLNARLGRAALAHAKNMVVRHYFSHNGPDGTPLIRIKKAGYIPRIGIWTVGENLAWGSGTSAAAGQIMTAWMNSPEHKANILTRGFKEIGIGIVAKAPTGGGAGATFTTDFGAVRLH